MSNLYMRHVEVIAGERVFSSKDYTIYFDIPFDDGPEINIADIDIYNLSNPTVAALKKGQKVTVNAGYEGDVGAVLVGTLQVPYTSFSSVDKITELTVADANDNWMQSNVKKTYKEGITAQQILKDLIAITKLKTGALKLPVNMVYSGAKTIEGKVGKNIVEIAKDCNAKVHVNKDKIFIREKSEGDAITFVLDAAHGLIGSPTPIEYEEKYNVVQKVKKTVTEKSKTKGGKAKKVTKYVNEYVEKTRIRRGFKVVSLLNANFTTDVVLKIVSKTANGVFRIEKGKHVSSGSSFYTEMEVFPK